MISNLSILIVFYKQFKSYKKFVRLSDKEKIKSPIPKKFVTSILSLGPTFIKLGQILSTRPDILPEQYILALETLQENVPPFEQALVKKIVETELKQPLGEVFSSFEMQPAASASLSQVHFARLKTGEKVAVKIRRPDIESRVNSDLKMLEKLLSMASFFKPKKLQNLNIYNLFQEFKRYSLQELDFSNEGHVYERFAKNFKENPLVTFPKIFWSHTSPSILVMERISGLRLNEVRKSMPLEARNKLSNAIIETLLQMFVRDGFFHADLHPGNIFFGEDGSIKLIDVGMYGELNDEQRERFILYWMAVVLKEKRRAFHHLTQLLERTSKADSSAFYAFYENILDEFYTSTIQQLSLTQTYLEIVLGAARFGFIPSPQMLMQAKALTTAENLAYILAPEFNFTDATKPIIIKAFAQRTNIENLSQRLSKSFPEWLLLGETASSALSSNDDINNYLGQEISKELAQKWDDFYSGNYEEYRYGESSVEIDMPANIVFNFVTRLAQYPLWHPIYTPNSHVIHVSGEFVFITPEIVGSVFRLDEIVDGYHVLSNGHIIECKRNKSMKWVAPLSILPVISLGTSLQLEEISKNKTRISEYFFFTHRAIPDIITSRKWFSKESLIHHIHSELTGVKNILESGNFSKEDVSFLWEGLDKPVRYLDGKQYEIDHINGGPMPKLIE